MISWWILYLCFAVKVVAGLLLPLSPDESYYWVWGQNLQLSYFDHPPMVAWMYAVSEWISPNPLSPRIVGLFFHGLTILTWWNVFKTQLVDEKLKCFLLLISLSPLIGFGGWIITPDTPLALFWALATAFYLSYEQKPSARTALLLGSVVGLGFLSKYQMVLFPLSVLTYWLWNKKFRQQNWLHIGLALIAALIFFSPVVIWNLQNNWASFRFQTEHGLGQSQWNPWWTLSYVLAQILILSPFFLGPVFGVSTPKNFRFLLATTVVPLAFFFVTSFRGVVEMNWPLVAHFSFYALVVFSLASARRIQRTLIVWGGLLLILLSHAFFRWIPNPPEKFNELSKYEQVSGLLTQAHTYASSYQMAAWAWAHHKKPVYKLHGMSRRDFFDELQPKAPKESLFYLLQEQGTEVSPWLTEKDYLITVEKKMSPDFELWKIERR